MKVKSESEKERECYIMIVNNIYKPEKQRDKNDKKHNTLKKYETRKIQLANASLNVFFHRQCQTHRIIPNYIQLKINKKHDSTKNSETSTKALSENLN